MKGQWIKGWHKINFAIGFVGMIERFKLRCAARDVNKTQAKTLRSILEYETAARLQRLELNFTMTVLTFTAGLTLVHTLGLNRLSERFLIRNLRLTYRSLDLKFSQKSVYDNFKVQLAHTRDNGLSRFLIRIEFESGIFFREFNESHSHFFLTCLRFGLDGKLNNGIRERHLFENDRMIFVTKSIARRCVL